MQLYRQDFSSTADFIRFLDDQPTHDEAAYDFRREELEREFAELRLSFTKA